MPRSNELKELAASRGLAWRRPGAKKVWGFERKATYASRLAAHEDCFPAMDALQARISEARGDVTRAAVAGPLERTRLPARCARTGGAPHPRYE